MTNYYSINDSCTISETGWNLMQTSSGLNQTCLWDAYPGEAWSFYYMSGGTTSLPTFEECALGCENDIECTGFEYISYESFDYGGPYCAFWYNNACDLLTYNEGWITAPNGYSTGSPVETFMYTGECDCDGSILDCAGTCGGSSFEVTLCEDTDGDGLGDPSTELDCINGEADGCNLPDFNLFLGPNGEVFYNSSETISGFQFNVDGATVLAASGGNAGVAGFTLTVGGNTGNTILGFALPGTPSITPGCGLLTNLSLSGDATGLSDLIFSDILGGNLPFEYNPTPSLFPNGFVQNCSDEYPDCAANAFDCFGECGGFAEVDECGVCGGDGIADAACDCDGNELDCAGVCGGTSVEVTLCEDTDGDGLGNPGSETTDCVDGGRNVTNGCNLPENNIYLNSDGSVVYNSSDLIAGFELAVDGATINSASGGDAGAAGFVVSPSGSAVIGYSMMGGTFGLCGTMISLDLAGDATGLSIFNFSDAFGESIDFVYYEGLAALDFFVEDCSDEYPNCAANAFDCFSECGGSAEVDECGVCGGDGIADGACDCDGNIDLGCGCGEDGPSGCDETCGSTLEFDECAVCGGDNSSCSDCANVPYGSSVFDECGTCDDNTSNDCTQDCTGEWGGEKNVCYVCMDPAALNFYSSDFTHEDLFSCGYACCIYDKVVFFEDIIFYSDDLHAFNPPSITSNPENIQNLFSYDLPIRFKLRIKNSLNTNILTGSSIIAIDGPFSQFVDITDNFGNTNNIVSGSSTWTTDEFEIKVSPSVPYGTILSFRVTSSSELPVDGSTGPWYSNFFIIFNPLALDFSLIDDDDNPDSYGDNDDIIEKNETIEIIPLIESKITNNYLLISSDDTVFSSYNSIFIDDLNGTLISENDSIQIWSGINGASGIVSPTYNYPSGFIFPYNSDFWQPEFDFVFDYNYSQPYEFDLNLLLDGYISYRGGHLNHDIFIHDTTIVRMKWIDSVILNEGLSSIPVNSLSIDKSFPKDFSLTINPNPFNPSTLITYMVPSFSKVSIDIYNINGELVESLIRKYNNPGKYVVLWNAANFTSGIYFVRMASGKYINTQKLMLVK